MPAEARPRRRPPRWLTREGTRWIHLPLVAPFLILFLLTAFPRLWTPYCLEWNEGHSAEQAWRVVLGQPLYPAPESGWVPYIYAPGYHLAFGALMKWFELPHLGLGRLVSLGASLLMLPALFLAVRDRTARVAPALLAPLLYAAFYEASGFWYDIARTDALANGLAAWGLYLTLKRRPTAVDAFLGLLCLGLSALTKQPMAAPALFAAGWLLARHWRRARWPAVLAAAVLANAVLLFVSDGNTHFAHYAFGNALKHGNNPAVAMPASQLPETFRAELPPEAGWRAALFLYLEQSLDAPPPIWSEAFRHQWLLWLLAGAWLALAAHSGRWPRGWPYGPVALLLLWGSVSGYLKVGGYVNNFMGAYLGLALLVPFAVEGVHRAFKGWAQGLADGVVAGLVAAQIFQPWNVPSLEDAAARFRVLESEPDAARREVLARSFRARGASYYVTGGWLVALEVKARQLALGGLFHLPGDQRPPAPSDAAWERMQSWLRERRRLGERVWVAHQQWYALLAGHEPSYNIDMARCAEYAGQPPPAALEEAVRRQSFDWIVLDMMDLEFEWLPSGLKQVIAEGYEFHSFLPFYGEPPDGRAMMPLTGAAVRPVALYRSRAFPLRAINPWKIE
ncbi:MAG: hypothetical protein SF028_00730 [Candidatus Sumerlaeia bacterium]|nr:hypothetical protein [Candidatus Sumerlaeia bacterium]